MIGRLDVRPGGPCPNCKGKGTDPKKRTRQCPVCFSSGRKLVCLTCGEDMPCSGTDTNVFDQAQCRKLCPVCGKRHLAGTSDECDW